MKHIKAYTFEELLNEIPELENKDIIYRQITTDLKTPFKRFCRENKLKYIHTLEFIHLNNVLHILFEKL